MESTLQAMSRNSSTLTGELESEDGHIQGLKSELAVLSQQLIEERASSSRSNAEVSRSVRPPTAPFFMVFLIF